MAHKFLTPFPEHTMPLVPTGQGGMFSDESNLHCLPKQIYNSDMYT